MNWISRRLQRKLFNRCLFIEEFEVGEPLRIFLLRLLKTVMMGITIITRTIIRSLLQSNGYLALAPVLRIFFKVEFYLKGRFSEIGAKNITQGTRPTFRIAIPFPGNEK
jgi:hypothetical protein